MCVCSVSYSQLKARRCVSITRNTQDLQLSTQFPVKLCQRGGYTAQVCQFLSLGDQHLLVQLLRNNHHSWKLRLLGNGSKNMLMLRQAGKLFLKYFPHCKVTFIIE